MLKKTAGVIGRFRLRLMWLEVGGMRLKIKNLPTASNIQPLTSNFQPPTLFPP
jgi:hypothetical protein